ncbi:MAG: TIGR02266 family protein [Deltaproteobacteria bacterium]|nr:TIGR02266 family protein [Deltaproteobacteria bacterium]
MGGAEADRAPERREAGLAGPGDPGADAQPGRHRGEPDGERELVAQQVEERHERQARGEQRLQRGRDPEPASGSHPHTLAKRRGTAKCGRAYDHLTRTPEAAYLWEVTEDDDKRIHPRAPIELKVEYKKLNTFFADYTKNISKGGTFIKTERPLPVGTEFLFKLSLPKRDLPFVLKGKVVWINQPGDQQRPEVKEMGMGIRFVFDRAGEREGFEGDVEKLMVESLGTELYEKLVRKAKGS